jgi:AP-1-like transcription factor
MLEESKQKNDSLTDAYSVLHAEFMKLRSVQSRHQQQQQQQQQQRQASINIPFDLSGMAGPVGAMAMMESWQLYNDMPSYGL